jgi:hypothetical protein
MQPQDLYGLPLEQFTDQRNALAKELRRSGRRDEAAAVSKLRKPSVSAWAVNQLVRTQRKGIEVLFEAGDTLAQAQADLLAGRGDAATLRQAVEAERAAVEQLIDKARGLLNADGHELTQARLEQVTETLHAAALDEDARTNIRDGCLDRELRHIGLGALGAVSDDAPGRKRARDDKREGKRGDGTAAARRAETAARGLLERARRELRAAERRHERAAEELREAERALEAARELATEAESEHQQARRRLN